jgi:hypothetical protein
MRNAISCSHSRSPRLGKESIAANKPPAGLNLRFWNCFHSLLAGAWSVFSLFVAETHEFTDYKTIDADVSREARERA